MYYLYLVKRWIEDLFIAPFILVGKIIAARNPLPQQYDIFFFFPFYHIGGAEKVHAQIAQALGNKNCIIYITRKSANDLFYEEFRKSGCTIKDISRYTDNKWIYFVNLTWRGIIAHYINKQSHKPVVFNGQCNFGYKISRWIKNEIPQVELIHSLCSFSYIRIPFLPFITKTIMISTIRIQQHLDLYKKYTIPEKYGKRIRFILNAIPLPEKKPLPKELNRDALTVLYVGRGTAEKRVQLIVQAAGEAHKQSLPVNFQFMGDVSEAVPEATYPNCHFWGNQSSETAIDSIYRGADILIIASDTEGFPMVIMEAMARGLTIISTAVGEIPVYVKQEQNGFLIERYTDESAVVQGILEYTRHLHNNRPLLKKIAENNIDVAYRHFGIERFNEEYRNVVQEVRSSAKEQVV